MNSSLLYGLNTGQLMAVTVACSFCLLYGDYFSVQPMPKGDHVLNFSDAEDIINDEDLR